MSFYTKRTLYLILAWGLALPCPAQSKPQKTDAAKPSKEIGTSQAIGFEYAFPALGTLVSLKAFSDSETVVEQAFQDVEREVLRLQDILTDYEAESETRRLTTDAFGTPKKVSNDLWAVLQASDRWHEKTNGAFDSSLGNLTQLWRKKRRVGKLPMTGEIQAALRSTGWQHVKLNRELRTVELLREGVRFDFGAIGKGYIVDRAFELLAEQGLESCLVNISGNMRMGTSPPGREGWRIEISPLEKAGAPLRRIECKNCAIATSGDLWQYVVIDGVRRSHILDPKTGIGVRGPIAATVLASTATDADALATAACVLAPAKAIQLAEEMPDVALLIAWLANEGDVRTVESKTFPSQ